MRAVRSALPSGNLDGGKLDEPKLGGGDPSAVDCEGCAGRISAFGGASCCHKYNDFRGSYVTSILLAWRNLGLENLNFLVPKLVRLGH